jgi:matrix metalloproteinase-14 (membrane-inserted)
LSQFGYLSPRARNPSGGNLIDRESWEKAIMDFQNFAGLNATGKFKINDHNSTDEH